jgi:small subunit ribosomal protein S16
VQDKRAPRDGRFIDHIGAFDPIKGDASVTVARDRLQYWLGTGAQMSVSVKNRLRAKLAEIRTEAPAAKPASESRSPEAK